MVARTRVGFDSHLARPYVPGENSRHTLPPSSTLHDSGVNACEDYIGSVELERLAESQKVASVRIPKHVVFRQLVTLSSLNLRDECRGNYIGAEGSRCKS